MKSSSLTNLGLKLKKSSPVPHVKGKKSIALGNNELFGVELRVLVHQFCLTEQVSCTFMSINKLFCYS